MRLLFITLFLFVLEILWFLFYYAVLGTRWTYLIIFLVILIRLWGTGYFVDEWNINDIETTFLIIWIILIVTSLLTSPIYLSNLGDKKAINYITQQKKKAQKEKYLNEVIKTYKIIEISKIKSLKMVERKEYKTDSKSVWLWVWWWLWTNWVLKWGLGGFNFSIGKTIEDGKYYYIFYKEESIEWESEKVYKLFKLPAGSTYISEGDYTPHLKEIIICKNIKRKNINKCKVMYDEKKYVLYVPKDTIINTYNINP